MLLFCFNHRYFSAERLVRRGSGDQGDNSPNYFEEPGEGRDAGAARAAVQAEVAEKVRTNLRGKMAALNQFVSSHRDTDYAGNWQQWNQEFATTFGKISGISPETQIRAMQQVIFNGDTSKVDGKIGPQTLAALADFANTGLPADVRGTRVSAGTPDRTVLPEVVAAPAESPEDEEHPTDEIVWVPEADAIALTHDPWIRHAPIRPSAVLMAEYRASQQGLDPSVLAFRRAFGDTSSDAPQPVAFNLDMPTIGSAYPRLALTDPSELPLPGAWRPQPYMLYPPSYPTIAAAANF